MYVLTVCRNSKNNSQNRCRDPTGTSDAVEALLEFSFGMDLSPQQTVSGRLGRGLNCTAAFVSYN